MTLTTPTYLIVTTTQRKSGIDRDEVINTWHYQLTPEFPGPVDYTNWVDNYRAFMTAIGTYMSPAMSVTPGDLNVAFWLLPTERGPLGAPEYEVNAAPATAVGAQSAPSEVSICLTLEADQTGIPENAPGGARPGARRRSRKYLGPLGTGAFFTEATTFECRPQNLVTTTIPPAYRDHMGTAMRADNWDPVCFSKTNWDAYPVVRAWIDNAFDTQRRRGQDPTVKYPVTLP
jgi:hypothetical protein